ncbi:hypothetical protein PRK78_007290 [Emydomyces testavorans]|uniref:Guanine nucleotide exchange factor n=1 Tax=Emydomyces testavorans TaxID=2070801 RepID=A0AAF0DMZ4_9EURO|nr:hypothetical protein PRK78_007290 [Emydomyces testavorans]
MQVTLQKLTTLLDRHDTADTACDRLLEQLSTLIKGPNGCELASSLGRSDVAVLGRYGFDDARPERRHLALRCLHNAMVQAPPVTEMFVNGGLPGRAVELMTVCRLPSEQLVLELDSLTVTPQSTNADDQFFAARLLIRCSADPAAGFLPDFEHGVLAETINAATALHASTGEIEPTVACTAHLRLILVLAAKYEAQAHHLLPSMSPILQMFERAPIRNPPLEPPMSLLIDCLAALVSHNGPIATSEMPWPPFNEDKLVNVLSLAIQAYPPEVLETRITPLASLLFKISQSGPAETKERLRAHLLPSDQDRTQVLGRGDSLPHRLVSISTETVSPELKKVMAHLFLELSDGDPKRLIHNVGFGCGVGLLHSISTPAPPDDSDTGQSTEGTGEINPVTGQRRDMETQTSLAEMTDEQKEREAERLFVLFERLRATGVLNVENPVGAALRSGRVE